MLAKFVLFEGHEDTEASVGLLAVFGLWVHPCFHVLIATVCISVWLSVCKFDAFYKYIVI